MYFGEPLPDRVINHLVFAGVPEDTQIGTGAYPSPNKEAEPAASATKPGMGSTEVVWDTIADQPSLEPAPLSQLQDKRRAALTALATFATMKGDYALIAAGKAASNYGVDPWLAAGATAAVTAGVGYTLSRAATWGIGDFSYEPKSRLGMSVAKLPPLVSLWYGPAAGSLLEQASGKEVSEARRLVAHTIPYSAAMGYWVTPTPLAEAVTGTVETVSGGIAEHLWEHPEQGAAGTGLLLGAALAATRIKRAMRRRS